MKIKLLAILILFQINVFAQKTYKLLDEVTKNPIAFASVYIENENYLINSDEKGEFILHRFKNPENLIVFNALGYGVKKINSADITSEIYLKPNVSILEEVKISTSKNTKQINIGTIKGNDSAHGSGIRTLFLLARYFPYSNEYKDYPLIKSITVLTKNKLKTAKFNLRIYAALNGKPSTLLNQKNITVEVKKGKKLTTINISDLNILMPDEGVFVAYEWLSIPSNYNLNNVTYKDSNGNQTKGTMAEYQPMICTNYENTLANTWKWIGGKWTNNAMKTGKNKNQYAVPAISLTLSN